MDPETGRTRVRLVDISSARYGIARRYMIRLRRDDFANDSELARLATAAKMSVEAFRARFGPLAALEPPQLDIGFTAADVG